MKFVKDDLLMRVGTIVLSCEDSIRFADAIFRLPVNTEHDRYIDAINRNVTITYRGDGFEADIADLELDFIANNIIE